MVSTLGQYLRKLREEKDLSLREFAKSIRCSPAFVSDIELGRRYPSPQVLQTMSKVLGVSLDELRSYDSRPPVEDIKRLAETNPKYALAFRQMIDQKIRPEDLLALLNKKSRKK